MIHRRSKRGSSAVFLMVILAALISIVLALIYGVREETVRSRADAVINLAGDSLLSEFDYYVQKEYGLFLLKGTDEALSEKLEGYLSYSFEEMEGVEIKKAKASAGRFSVTDLSLVKAQILEYMKFAEAAGVLEKLAPGNGARDDSAEEAQGDLMEEQTLRHGPTMASLPSAQLPKKSLTASAEALADKASEVDRAFQAGTDNYLLNRYVMQHFNSRNRLVNGEHFFCNEVEYILGGEFSDQKNEKRLEIALKAMRFPINLAYLYTDPEKQAALAAMAQVLTPGAAAAATQAALASTWAYAEADNDVELLWQGHKVPMVKDASSWAIDLESAVEGVFGGTVKPAVEKGYDYDQYLQILLFFQDENTKLARILDLIQINMRKNHDGDFLIQEHATGIVVEVEINGKKYGYEKQY